MSRVFINIDFDLSPIVWCKKNFNHKLSVKNFYLSNENCTISQDIQNDNVKEICPLAKYILIKNHNSIMWTEQTYFAKYINISINSFVKDFQHVKSDLNRHANTLIKTKENLENVCKKCKNSKNI